MRSAECVVVGGGPAGLAAARTAARAGVRVMLVDENAELGGQYYRQMPAAFRALESSDLGREHLDGSRLVAEVKSLGVELRLETVVWSIFDGHTVPEALLRQHSTRRGMRRQLVARLTRPLLAGRGRRRAVDHDIWNTDSK